MTDIQTDQPIFDAEQWGLTDQQIALGEQARQLMTTFCKRYGLECGVSYGKPTERPKLRCDLFRVVEQDGTVQRELF